MPDLHLTPNVEALVSAFLREQDELVDLVADRVYTTIPKSAVYPLVQVTVLDSTPTHGGPLWHEAHLVQIDAFGGSKDEARRISATARALMSSRLEGTHPEGVVTGVVAGGMLDLPDESYTPAKMRWLFTSTVLARPVATIGAS